MPTKIQLRRDNYINFGNAQTALGSTPLLSSGEPAFDSGSRLRIGDGNLTFQKLPVYVPLTHFSVLGTDDSSFGVTAGDNENVFGDYIDLIQSEAYEIEYQLVGTYDSTSTSLTVAIENYFHTGSPTPAVENFVVDWTCHRNVNTTGYENLSFYGTLSSDANGPIVRDVSLLSGQSESTRSFSIHKTGNVTGNYFFTFRAKGIVVGGGGVTQFSPRFVYSNVAHLGSLTVTAGSYIKVTGLGPSNTMSRSGNWS